MKRAIVQSLLVGLVLLVAMVAIGMMMNAAMPSLASEYTKTAIFRPWSDPLMSLYYLHPFILGLVFVYVWHTIKSSFGHMSFWQKVGKFTILTSLISTLPGMLMTYSSFRVSLGLVASWTLSGIVSAFIASYLTVKLDV